MTIDILIVSSLYDFSTDLVVQDLEKNNVSYLRINKECFSDYRISIDPINTLLRVDMSGKSYIVDSSVKSIWYRQPIFLRNSPGESLSIDDQLKRSQWMGFLRSLSIFNNSRWMNPLNTTYLAETKAYQLMIAKKLGFHIPSTTIGNDVNRFKELDKKVILKSLDTVLLREKDECLFTYSTISNIENLSDEESYEAPFTIQEYIYPKIDVRVTIIGNEVFAVKITSNGAGVDNDWRLINRDKIEYTDIQLPDNLQKLCIKLLRELGLNFGAIDLILSNENYYFIEINPTGEWGWLVDDERRIDLSISRWLTQR